METNTRTMLRTTLLAALADILEVAEVKPETVLDEVGSWDSMSVIVATSVIDDTCGRVVDGIALGACRTAGDVLVLAGFGEEQTIGAGDVGDLGAVLG